MYLIAAVEPFRKQGPRQEFTLHVLSYLFLMLRKCVLVDQHACRFFFLFLCWTLGLVGLLGL